MYSNSGLAMFPWAAYFPRLSRDSCMNGPPDSVNIDAVPSRTLRADCDVMGRAVRAVRGVRKACSTVPGRPDCVAGRTTPLRGRPVCVRGLKPKSIKNLTVTNHTTSYLKPKENK